MSDGLIDRMGRHFMVVRKAGGARVGGHKPVYHAVTPACRIALCGAEPGPRSGWGEAGAEVTCPGCRNRLARLQVRDGRGPASGGFRV